MDRPQTSTTREVPRATLLAYIERSNNTIVSDHGLAVSPGVRELNNNDAICSSSTGLQSPSQSTICNHFCHSCFDLQKTLQGELARTSQVASTVAAKLEFQRQQHSDLEQQYRRLTEEHVTLLKYGQMMDQTYLGILVSGISASRLLSPPLQYAQITTEKLVTLQ